MEKYAFKTGNAVEELLKNSQKDWKAAVNHRFVKELFEGTIEDEVLIKYLIQDYHFFDAFLSMLGLVWHMLIRLKQNYDLQNN